MATALRGSSHGSTLRWLGHVSESRNAGPSAMTGRCLLHRHCALDGNAPTLPIAPSTLLCDPRSDGRADMPAPKPLPLQLEPLLLYPSRLRAAFVCALFGIAVGVVSYGWFVLIALFCGATVLWLFGPPTVAIVLWLLFSAWKPRARQPLFIPDEDGITDCRLGERPVAWDDIAQFEVKLTRHGGTNLMVVRISW